MPRLLRIPRRRRRGGSLRRYLGADEQTLLVTRQHPFALLRAALDCLGLLAPLVLAAWGIAGIEFLRGAPGTWILRALFLVMVVLVVRLAWRVLEWEFERVVISNEKVIHIAGVLDRRIASTPLAKVSEFTVRQPLLGRVFDFGSLVVDVPRGRDQALHGLAFIPDPAGMYRLVSGQARTGRMQEGGGRAEEERLQRTGLREDGLEIVGSAMSPTSMPVPTEAEVEALRRPDPWAPTLEGDEADHTLRIPRIPPRH